MSFRFGFRSCRHTFRYFNGWDGRTAHGIKSLRRLLFDIWDAIWYDKHNTLSRRQMRGPERTQEALPQSALSGKGLARMGCAIAGRIGAASKETAFSAQFAAGAPLTDTEYPERIRAEENSVMMIVADNFRAALRAMGFVERKKNVYEKTYPASHCTMRADFNRKKLIYPPEIEGGQRNDSFNVPENFVVFECVNRLLDKGYRPEHIVLEKQWNLGHEAKGGRADICVKDGSTGEILFIIECKTWGSKFDKALNDTKSDGGQLFSYWQQEQSCRWLVLYASSYQDGGIVYKAPTIDCSDDANIILLAKKDKTIKLYRDARTTVERYETWRDTYTRRFHGDLIFSDDSVTYQIGVKPLRKKKLQEFKADDKIVNKFEEILRHNNVSDKENAFNRLIALFICKLVDESTKSEDDELEFQYKQGTDTYEELQDRLQRLHRDGMEKFMREEILYVPADYPERLFSAYTGTERKRAIEDLRNTIRILKFYSNNDFTFKDVHNEELFYQNGKILVEMVQLFENYKIVYPSKHQFLGDLFEQLLNKGFKQNEGQFFTPMPIARFIWDSLPVERMVKSERGTVYPKVIDYSCGAGHFLTEAIEAINHFAGTGGNNAWVRDHIYGIEKDYRLARVAKISLFMNGAGEGNIIFGDGLENAPDKGIENGAFDILVANPPYAVKDFKQHLQLKNNSFQLLGRIGLNGGEIETLFVERIGQLLRPGGIAAVILPSSILSNDSASYTGAREQLLQHFYIRAIVAFGSKTFGATGTNTVAMFLEKFVEPPKQSDLAADSVDAIFDGGALDEWRDGDILGAYLEQIEVEKETYRAFLNRTCPLQELETAAYFKMYTGAFADSPEAKNLQKTRTYQNKSACEQAAAYRDRFYAYAHAIEREKLFYFALVYQQRTVVITAPADNRAQKEFLGYDWSNRKGNEGIQIIAPGGRMFDAGDRAAEGTLADVIKKSFYGAAPSIGPEQGEYATLVYTSDLLDFSRAEFNKTLRLRGERGEELKSRYPQKYLFDVAACYRGVTYDKGEQRFHETSNIVLTADNITLDGRFEVTKRIYLDESRALPEDSRLRAGDIFICMSSGSRKHVGKAAYIASDTNFYAGGFMGIIRTVSGECLPKYLYYILNTPAMRKRLSGESTGANINNLSSKIGAIRIPVPPLAIQQQLVDACGRVDEESRAARIRIEARRGEVEALFDSLDAAGRQGHRFSLSNAEDFSVSIGNRVLNAQLDPNGTVPVYSANVTEPFGYINTLLLEDFSIPSVLWGIDGDWMTSYMPENAAFYPTDHCGVLRCMTPEVNPRYLAHLLGVEGRKMGFSRSYRASIDRIQGITFSAPDIDLQNKTIEKVLALEGEIAAAEEQLAAISGRREELIKTLLER